jgi:hypothetical protein
LAAEKKPWLPATKPTFKAQLLESLGNSSEAKAASAEAAKYL